MSYPSAADINAAVPFTGPNQQPSRAGVNSILQALAQKGGVSLLNYIPQALQAAIIAGTSTVDVTTYFQEAVDENVSLYVPDGTYIVNGPVTLPVTFKALYGSCGAVIDCSGASDSTTVPAFFWSGSLTDLPDLSASPVKYGQALTFASAPTLSPGDAIVIYNPTDSSYSPWRTAYRAGEYCTVRDVSGTGVTLATRLYAGYTNTAVDLAKLNPAYPTLSNLTFIAPSNNTYVLEVKWARNLLMEDITIRSTDPTNGLVSINKVYGGAVRNCVVDYLGSTAPLGTAYAIVVSCSQDLTIEGRGMAFRHAVSVGGGSGSSGGVATEDGDIVNRNVVFRGGTYYTTDTAYGSSAADLHGNCEYCGYEDVHIVGGMNYGGNFNFLRNVTIYTPGTNYAAIRGGELTGFDHFIDGLTVYAIGNNVNSASVLDIGLNNAGALTSDTSAGGTFKISNVKVLDESSTVTSTTMIAFRNRGCTQTLNLDFSNLTLNGVAAAGYGNVLFVDCVSGSQFNIVNLADVKTQNGSIAIDSGTDVTASAIRINGGGLASQGVRLVSSVNNGSVKADDIFVRGAVYGGVVMGTLGGTTGQTVDGSNITVRGYHTGTSGFDFLNAGVCVYGNGSVQASLTACGAYGDGGAANSGGDLRADTIAVFNGFANRQIVTQDTVPVRLEIGSNGANLSVPGLVTSDPGGTDLLWDDAGTVTLT
jgi:hypothetical protein